MMDIRRQLRIAVIGLPDGGKSTFISNAVRCLTDRVISTDTLMHEVHYSDGKDIYGNDDTRTIKCAKIMFPWKDYEICLYDCPGHLEYSDEILQGIEAASVIIKLYDEQRINESCEYYSNDIFKVLGDKLCITLYSHCEYPDGIIKYNVDSEEMFKKTSESLFELIDKIADPKYFVDVVEEAEKNINDIFREFSSVDMFFSGGKDSLVGLHLLYLTNNLDKVRIWFPKSGDDFPEVEEMIKTYSNEYNIVINEFPNNYGMKPDDVDGFTWMKNKAKANNELIEKEDIKCVFVQYRASDEGVRSKDYHISRRKDHTRFSPVFYFSESNIWRFISKYNLKYCELYNKGFRSLGDKSFTVACMPCFNDVESIVEYIETNYNTRERDGRKRQDNSESFAMEKLRNVGFF